MTCVCCGSKEFRYFDVLWPELIAAWGLSAQETAYINRQQGRHCALCDSSLRVQALALAIMRFYGFSGTFSAFTLEQRFRALRVLEINPAGALNRMLSDLPGHQLVEYPGVEMTRLQFGDGSFDLVVHSDTLEHVADPIAGLRECRRVLADTGACAFTVPMIVGRLTRSRLGLPPSYHGSDLNRPDYLVHTEYGADAWTQVVQAGFAECRLVVNEFPAAIAMLAVRQSIAD
jgi:SAM-dependent methyltransferase